MTAVEKKQIMGTTEKLLLTEKHGLKRELIFFQLKQRASTKGYISTKAQEHKLHIIKSIERDMPLK